MNWRISTIPLPLKLLSTNIWTVVSFILSLVFTVLCIHPYPISSNNIWCWFPDIVTFFQRMRHFKLNLNYHRETLESNKKGAVHYFFPDLVFFISLVPFFCLIIHSAYPLVVSHVHPVLRQKIQSQRRDPCCVLCLCRIASMCLLINL